MGEIDEGAIREMLTSAVYTGNSSQLLDCSMELQIIAQDIGNVPASIFEFLLELIQERTFLELKESHSLLLAFELTWEFLSVQQKKLLLGVLENAYTEFSDWMSWFVISELLGEYYKDRQALDTLRRLRSVSADHPRSFIPHGLEHLTKSSEDDIVRRDALQELLQMKGDPSAQVQYEVDISLQRLGRKTYRQN